MKLPEKAVTAMVCLLLVAAVFGVFWGGLNCEFVNYDDPAYITSNEMVKGGLSWPGIQWAFNTGTAANWHPLTWISHMADATIWHVSPRGHHLTNLVFHAANAALLFLLLKYLTGSLARSALVAALFALHPLRVESVVWISERKDVLSTFFWILAVWFYALYARNRLSKRFYAAALLCFALGLMAKPMLVTLPLVLLLLDYWPLTRRDKNVVRLCLEKIPFFALALASSLVTFLVQRRGGAVSPVAVLSPSLRLCNAFISYVRYLQKTFWPLNLSVLYPHPRQWPAWEVMASILFLAVVSAWVIWRRKKQPYLAVGWFWYLIILLPVIGLVQVGIQSMADRYSYVPVVGIFIMGVWAAADALGEKATLMMGALAIAACMVLTPIQVGYWHDSEALFEHAVAVTDDNYLAYNNIGFYLSNRGKDRESMKYFQSALQINPNYEDAHNNLGFAMANLGSNQAAIAEYIKALSINSNLTEAHNNLGNALSAVGRNDEAMHEYLVALEENPHHAEAHNNYGIALAQHGRVDDAVEQFRMAIRDKPDYTSAHSDLGNALAMQGKFDQAVEEYQFVLRQEPTDAKTHNNLASVLAQQGHLEEAVEHYRTALKLAPVNPEAHCNLAYCLARQGHRPEAEQEYEAALAQKPDYAAARQQLQAFRNSAR